MKKSSVSTRISSQFKVLKSSLSPRQKISMYDLLSHQCSQFIHQTTTDNSNFWIDLVSTVITLLAVIVALFREWFLSFIFKPKLTFKTVPAVLQKDPRDGGRYTMYRLLVINNGSTSAQDVRALLTSVNQPLNLTWTNIDKITRDISKDEPAYLDVVQEKGGKFYFYPWGDIIDSDDYNLSSTSPTKIKINFYEKNQSLQVVILEIDPISRELKVQH